MFQITCIYRLIASRKVFICQSCNLQTVIIGCLSQLFGSFGFEFCYLQPVLSCNAFNGKAYIAGIVSICIVGKCTVIVYISGSECGYFMPRLVICRYFDGCCTCRLVSFTESYAYFILRKSSRVSKQNIISDGLSSIFPEETFVISVRNVIDVIVLVSGHISSDRCFCIRS